VSASEKINPMETEQLLEGLSPAPSQGDFAAKMLSGSQRKTAFAIRLNSERLIREDGLNCSGFLTLTVGDYFCETHGKQIPEFKDHCPCCKRRGAVKKMQFCGIYNADEASERINSVRGFLLTIFKRAILVTERHKSKRIHFHLLVSLASGADIRTGLNFEAVRQRRYSSASPALLALWELLRERLPKYGFGRHELLPIRKTGEAVAAYISKYIEKNVCNRTPGDKRKKLVRYLGWEKCQLKPNEFEWDGVRARAWRAKTAQVFAVAGCELRDFEVNPPSRIVSDCVSAAGKIRPKMLDGSEIKRKFGARWAMVGTGIWCQIEGDNVAPFIDWTAGKKLKAIHLLGEAQKRFESELISNFRWLKGLDIAKIWGDEFAPEKQDEETARYDWWKLEGLSEQEKREVEEYAGQFARN
jgi:hypothetical protein